MLQAGADGPAFKQFQSAPGREAGRCARVLVGPRHNLRVSIRARP